jgi:DNA-directed RNA polymerase specialized sigma24 family protein
MEIVMSQARPVPLHVVPSAEAEAMVSRLYRENGGYVLSYVTGLLRDRYLAEDVVQETMLRAWRHCGELSPEKGSVRGSRHALAILRRGLGAEVAEPARLAA